MAMESQITQIEIAILSIIYNLGFIFGGFLCFIVFKVSVQKLQVRGGLYKVRSALCTLHFALWTILSGYFFCC
tara:strand:- start:6923 stop:7141 length:219 start_codon:yes stop_codon:yes gene_type:complete